MLAAATLPSWCSRRKVRSAVAPPRVREQPAAPSIAARRRAWPLPVACEPVAVRVEVVGVIADDFYGSGVVRTITRPAVAVVVRRARIQALTAVVRVAQRGRVSALGDLILRRELGNALAEVVDRRA